MLRYTILPLRVCLLIGSSESGKTKLFAGTIFIPHLIRPGGPLPPAWGLRNTLLLRLSESKALVELEARVVMPQDKPLLFEPSPWQPPRDLLDLKL